MRDAIPPLPFEADDLRLLPVERVAAQLRTSHAFVRLCVAAGCPTRKGGLLSAAELLHWLFRYYRKVRALAGLAPIVAIGKVTPEAAVRLHMANGLFTLFEFGGSRATDARAKQQFAAVWAEVDRALDRG
jgi:hypothetical protein